MMTSIGKILNICNPSEKGLQGNHISQFSFFNFQFSITFRVIVILHFSFLISHCFAQNSLLLRDYQFVRQQDAWLTGSNAAGLTRYASANIAEAEVSMSLGRGGFVNYDESPKTISVDAGIESYFRISPKTVVYGRMSYDNFTGRQMTGSAFLSPLTPQFSILNSQFSISNTRLLPLNIVEDSLTNEGCKHRDIYQLTGAVGVDVWRGIALGARVDYTAANYAKYKDLRHKNKLMELTATAGASFPIARWITVGANYRYHRSVESVTFGTYGKGDKVYKSLIDYGNFIGRVEQFGNYGFTDRSREMPLFDDGHGLDVQLSTDHRPLSTFHSFSYDHRSGYYGRRSPYTITFTNHGGNHYAYYGQLSLHTSPSTLHQLALRLESEVLKNNATTYRELKNESGSDYYEYYDDVKTGDKLQVNTTLDYSAHLGIRHELPTWTLNAALALMHRKQTAYLYPYFRRQDIRSVGASLQCTRNVVMQRGVLSVGLMLGYLKGRGEPFEDGTFATPSDKQTSPDAMDAFLWREYLYLTAPQYSIGAHVKYAFIFPRTRLKTYTRLDVSHRKSNETNEYSNGKNHTQVSLVVGCDI